jgi:ribosomal protein S20
MSSISAVSSNGYDYPSQFSGIRNDVQALEKALNSDDLAGAKTAFAAFQQDVQKVGQPQQSSQNSLQTDLQDLEKALSSGDIDGAKKAFAAFQQDVQNKIGHGHHHHHHHPQATQSTGDSTTATTGDSSTGNTINLLG